MTPIQTIAADIAKELREHPERWTQGSNARRADGAEVSQLHPDAVSFCLAGHIYRRDGGTINAPCTQFARLGLGSTWPSLGALTCWNDWKGRTVADVIELCERVATAQRHGDAS